METISHIPGRWRWKLYPGASPASPIYGICDTADENRLLCNRMSGISVSVIKIDKSTRNEGNPGIKSPIRSTSEEENCFVCQ